MYESLGSTYSREYFQGHERTTFLLCKKIRNRNAARVHIGGDKQFLIEDHLKDKPRNSSNKKQDIVQLCLD